jgi:hypothetical protein
MHDATDAQTWQLTLDIGRDHRLVRLRVGAATSVDAALNGVAAAAQLRRSQLAFAAAGRLLSIESEHLRGVRCCPLPITGSRDEPSCCVCVNATIAEMDWFARTHEYRVKVLPFEVLVR